MSLAKRRHREAALLFSLRDPLVQFGHILQGRLFPVLEAELGPLSDLQQQLVRTLTLLQLDAFVEVRCGRGRPAHDRAAIARLRGQGGVQSTDDAGVAGPLAGRHCVAAAVRLGDGGGGAGRECMLALVRRICAEPVGAAGARSADRADPRGASDRPHQPGCDGD